ncbi:MAG: HAMP domain-containing protein [Lachnospiraceae bacterium]|nr:HAMP domain-containing protein [Lachnospiraceae bacterium]
MKFRYKVLFTNLILLSVSLGIVGYLMIQKNFELAKETQMENAFTENNLVQSSVEYELLQILNRTDYHIREELAEIGGRVSRGMIIVGSSYYIRYDGEYVYSGDGQEALIGAGLFENLDVGRKNYLICQEGTQHYVYVTSYNLVEDKPLSIITKRNITEIYTLMQTQIWYYRAVLASILLVASAMMYLVSVYLTGPLERLNVITEKIAAGEYDTRAVVHSGDEIGRLAKNYNVMAAAVSAHIDQLQDMIHRRDQFVADFTHEIKTPMTTIIGYADTMRSMNLPREEEIMCLNYIFSEGKRLEKLSGKLFELIYLKQHEIEKKSIHVSDMEHEIIRIVAPALARKKIQFLVTVEPAVLWGNRELLVTVFLNLIDNARKASEEGGVIELRGKKLANGYEMCVADYGVGMSAEEAGHICDEFYMVDKSRTRNEGGAGLGLSLAALILERHGASLLVESQLQKGTTMRVVFQGEQVS